MSYSIQLKILYETVRRLTEQQEQIFKKKHQSELKSPSDIKTQRSGERSDV